ncbi:srg family chemoreceptor domain-containing protein [Ditylenchus destructor]|uniref:Serpentine receptor class gamma n=1 Tax=Ditylenchus destructor TaxID=166010 RepID=A0AAD4MNR3_9BILA|nr:srg family chemoreceptor domain-containing protein [Ditylenchus destructor]
MENSPESFAGYLPEDFQIPSALAHLKTILFQDPRIPKNESGSQNEAASSSSSSTTSNSQTLEPLTKRSAPAQETLKAQILHANQELDEILKKESLTDIDAKRLLELRESVLKNEKQLRRLQSGQLAARKCRSINRINHMPRPVGRPRYEETYPELQDRILAIVEEYGSDLTLDELRAKLKEIYNIEMKRSTLYNRLLPTNFKSPEGKRHTEYNFFNYFLSYFYMRLGCLGLFIDLIKSMPSQVLGFGVFLNYYSFHADNLSTMFILLNRLTSIIFPVGHTKIWKYLLPVSILVTYLTPLPYTILVISYKWSVLFHIGNGSFTLFVNASDPSKIYDDHIASAYIAAVSALLFSLICGALNVAIIILYRQKNKDMRTGETSMTAAKLVEQQIESRLTIYAIITFMGQLSMAIFYIFVYSATKFFFDDFDLFLSLINQFCWVLDLSTIVLPAWFLLWASSKVKEKVCSMVLPRSWIARNEARMFKRQHSDVQ